MCYHNGIRVLFACRLCTQSFKTINDFIVHKKENHFQEFNYNTCIVFEEKIILNSNDNGDDQPAGFGHSLTPSAPTVQVKLEIPDDATLDLEQESTETERCILVAPKFEQVIFESKSASAEDETPFNFKQEIELKPKPICKNPSLRLKRLSCQEIQKFTKGSAYRDRRRHKESHEEARSSPKHSPPCNPYLRLERPNLPQKNLDDFLQQHRNLRLKFKPRKKPNVHGIKSREKAASSGGNSKPLICPVCHKSFKYPCRYSLHLKLHTGSKPVKCLEPGCPKHFRENSEMKTHFNRVHSVKTEENGGIPRKRKRSHVQRSEVEPDEKSFMCQICGLAFAKNYILKSHHQVVHEDARPYACPHPDCNMAFKTQTILSSHKRIHMDPDSRFKCHYADCDKSFTTNYKLNIHLQTMSHTGVPPPKHLVCHIKNCRKSFDKRRELNRHFITAHGMDGELPRLPCSFCGKIFNRKLTLAKHIMTHTGQQPFKCTFPGCNKAYTSITPFKDHERKHTGERPFMCDMCGKDFRTKQIFVRHLKAAHPTMPASDTRLFSLTKHSLRKV